MYDFLSDVKSALKITGTYHDATLNVYIYDVKDYLMRAGVSDDLINSKVCSGVIIRGVSDLMTNATLSSYFHEKVRQLALSKMGVGG